MSSYVLKFPGSNAFRQKTVEFQAVEPSFALFVASREKPEQDAELWCEEKRLCNLRLNAMGFWEISRAAREERSG